MTTLAPIVLSRTPTNVTSGLTEGETYVAQNVGVGGGVIEYCNFATDPTDADVGWRIVVTYGFFQFEAAAADPVWARCVTADASVLSIGPVG